MQLKGMKLDKTNHQYISKYNKTSEYIYFSYFIIISYLFNGYVHKISIIFKMLKKKKILVIAYIFYSF